MTDWRRRPHLRVIDGTAGSNSGPQLERPPTLNRVLPFRPRVAANSDRAPRSGSKPSSDPYPGGDAA
jgi:hypothetical protein